MELDITLSELGTAFRKAKVGLYYSTNTSLFTSADYEESLEDNLRSLQKRINGKSIGWAKKEDFFGTWALVSKSIAHIPHEVKLGLLGACKFTGGEIGVSLDYVAMLRSARK